ncbi:hypothetical protein MSG28_015714 [Choristoneura fumiferana]|uniref:Uncharacterized protein n=1 Tax=Choristoneura fumiferana TaxID=7141 RepID=A0ACC0KCE2_CHOFU|nr:hypothetical protein MSG28_015714 [Choristoneura fumiferana]
MADGVRRFSNGVRGPGDELSVGLQQDGATTWLRSRDLGGCGKHKTGLSGEPWGRPMSSSGGLWADMMMMMSKKLVIASKLDRRLLNLRVRQSGPAGAWPVAICILLLGCRGYAEQRFAMEPQDQSAIIGSRVTLPCRVENKAGELQWTRDDFGLGTNRNLSGYDRYFMIGSDEEGDYSLDIRDVTLEDDAKYQCQVSSGKNGEPPIRSRYAQLSVLVAPNPPRIIQGAFIDATEEQPVDIECVSVGGKPAAEITWVDGNQAVIRKHVENSVELLPDGQRFKTRSVLRLTPSKEHHRQTITCQAQNTADRAARMATVHIEVRYAPKVKVSINSGDANGRFPEGSDARVKCEVDANPKAQVYRWYINNNPVVGDYTDEMIIFCFTPLRPFNIIIQKWKMLPPLNEHPPIFRTKPIDVEAELGSSVTLSCDVDGQPQPEIRWILHEPGRIGVKGKAPNLKIQVKNETAGRYICKATVEGYPEIESEATVFIKGTPTILSNRTQFGSEGDIVRIECAALSVPKPDDIRWFFEGREINSIQNPDYATLEETMPDGIVKSTLVIRASQSKHYGLYNCSVTNEYGNANAAIALKPLKSLPLFIILIGVTSGIIIFSAFIILLVICNRRRRQKSQQMSEKPDVTVTTCDMYNKESDRSSNISDLKLQLPHGDGSYELDYTSSDRSESKLQSGLPLAGPVTLPSIRHDDPLMQFRYSNDYSDPAYHDSYYKNPSGYVYDYPHGYTPPNNLRVQSPTQLDVPAANRQYKFVACADVEKMFRQVLIQPDQRSLQLIFWRETPADPLHVYQLNTVTYGTASAPYLSMRCVRQLAQECGDDVIARVINQDVKHRFTVLLFEYEHKRLLHAGPQLLLSTMRECWWPLGARNLARNVVRQCVICTRFKPKLLSPIMGNLPCERLEPGFPFIRTGVDYAGPMYILNRKGKGAQLIKSYVCLFVCMITRAIHLELVTSLSTDDYLLALKRFISRRGKPQVIFSDNAKNFVGADKDLPTFLNKYSKDIVDSASNDGIKFSFIPPYSPHFGGLWESGVRNCKFHLKRVVGNARLTYEEFSTVLTQIEAVLNSRPLSPMSSDPNDLSPLTPAHFLIGRPLTSPASNDLTTEQTTSLPRYARIEQLRQHFWQRWSKEYISELQLRTKWKTKKDDIILDSLVLIKDDNLPPLKWRLGRVTRLFPGNDGVSRVADIRTATGTVRRAFSKICPLLPKQTDSESLQGSLTRSIDTASTLPLSAGNGSQNNSLQRTKKPQDETDAINNLGLPVGGDTPPVYAQKGAPVDLRYVATYGNPYLRNSSLGYPNQVHTAKPASTPAPPPYSAVRSSVVMPTGTHNHPAQGTHV